MLDVATRVRIEDPYGLCIHVLDYVSHDDDVIHTVGEDLQVSEDA